MNANLTITLPDHVMMREVGGESILLDLETEKYFGLDEVGTDVVTRMSSGQTLGETVAALLEIYEVEEKTLAADVESLLEELSAHGLLTTNG